MGTPALHPGYMINWTKAGEPMSLIVETMFIAERKREQILAEANGELPQVTITRTRAPRGYFNKVLMEI